MMNAIELLLFSIGTNETFGIEVSSIKEIIKTPTITSVPHTKDGIMGMLSLRGVIIPVIDLNKTIKIESETPSQDELLIITEVGNQFQALRIHSVGEIVKVNSSEVNSTNSMTFLGESLKSVLELQDQQLVLVLDVNHIVQKYLETN